MRRFRRPVHTYERHERKPGKKISFYWQQVGFDSVSSQQRPRLDAFYTENIFFKKTVLFLNNPEEKRNKLSWEIQIHQEILKVFGKVSEEQAAQIKSFVLSKQIINILR